MLITSLVLLWFQIKWATFIGLGILLISAPATTIFIQKLTIYRREMIRHTYQRVKLMNQLLVGIRVLKMYAWEAAQEAAVLEVRKKELGELRKAVPTRVGMQTLFFAAPSIALATCFAVYGSVQPDNFTPAAVFTSISLFAIMRFPLILLPFALIQLTNALVSMRRLTQYFLLEDRKDLVTLLDSPGIEIKGGDFFWADPPLKVVVPEGGKKKGKGKGKGKGGDEVATTTPATSFSASSLDDKTHTLNNEDNTESGKATASLIDSADTANKDDDGNGGGTVSVALPSMEATATGREKGMAWRISDVNLSVCAGELVCVVGRVGSGKSSLVQAILGEMEMNGGSVGVGGKVAYAAQQAWIINASVKENVAFGLPFDQGRWEHAVEACCLAADLDMLPAGADTEIGEKGINLSGGQKQRISLARALYQAADVYILDDPLSAVDVHVGRHIFENFIQGAISGKARLLVTNQLQYVHHADRIVVMEAGGIVAQGTYAECQSNETFAKMLSEHNSQADVVDEAGANAKKMDRGATRNSSVKTAAITDLEAHEGDKGLSGVGAKEGGVLGRQIQDFETMRIENPEAKKIVAGKDKKDAPFDKAALMIKEDQEVGQVAGKIYWKYIQAYGVVSFMSLILLWSAEQAIRILARWYLSLWTNSVSVAQVDATINDKPFYFNHMPYVGGYLGFSCGYVLLTSLRAFTNFISALQASRVIHCKSLTALVRAPVTFFDTTPVGRILNRFSKDMDDVDFQLSMSMSEFGSCIMQLLATFIFLAVIQPIILAGIVPLMVIYYFLQRFYRKSYIEMQRLDSVSRSPIYAHFSESLSGVETIRAYRLADAFAYTSDARVDANHRAFFTARMANEWMTLRLDVIGACIVFLTAILAIVNRDSISASLAALTLTEALDVTLFLKMAVTSGAMFETRFNSLERLTAYWELPQEAPAQIEETKPDDDWPTEGAISYEDVWMRYRPELEPVLRGISFEVSPGDKVGIVGRTGSGKSSLIVSLFRLVEPYQGSIMLDGVNILSLGLDDVRGRIAAIPQDPVLFSGSVRSNLDPYAHHTDAELWDALGHVALKEVVARLPEGLSAQVAEGGENFSVGQRQLLCVGRALLRKPQVLVADEATASVDSETDALIQRTIRREFRHCTVLTIAHRINTILDSTRVLVMEDGLVKEYDEVPTLMGRQTSTFRAMVLEAGLESPAVSRSGSMQSLAGSPVDDGSLGDSRLPKGMNTFVNRMKEYGAK